MNINTKEYWEQRFESGNWEESKGREQTKNFAKSQIPFFKIPLDFEGSILDFGCGLGDAIPVYKENYPKANLLGMDISASAIKKCIKSYGDIATFFDGEVDECPCVDIIIASNVFEHLSDDISIASKLLKKCSTLYIVVPYKEYISKEGKEHIRSYDEHYYKSLGYYDFKVFLSKGWTEYSFDLFYQIYFKNILRPFFGKSLKCRNKQIMFCFLKNNLY